MITSHAMARCGFKLAARLHLLFLAATLLLSVGCAATVEEGPKTERTYSWWPTFPDEPRIQYLVSFERGKDIEPPTSALDKLVTGNDVEQVMVINKPYGLRSYEGRIYVCDIGTHHVMVLDVPNRAVRVLQPAPGVAMDSPTDLAIAPDGIKYVADMNRGTIVVFDAKDKYMGILGHQAFKPAALAVWQDELAVCDFQNRRLEIMNRFTGKTIRTIGSEGPKDGQFGMPLSVAYDAQGNIYSCDMLRCRIQIFSHEGKLLRAFGEPSTAVGNFIRPKHISVDREGLIYVVDAAFQNVQIFNGQGQVLTLFGGAGPHPGAMYLPVGVCVTESGLETFQKYVHPAFQAERLIFVSNQFGINKVAVYALGHLKPGKTLQDISAGRANVNLGLETNPTTAPTTLPTTLPATGPTTRLSF